MGQRDAGSCHDRVVAATSTTSHLEQKSQERSRESSEDGIEVKKDARMKKVRFVGPS